VPGVRLGRRAYPTRKTFDVMTDLQPGDFYHDRDTDRWWVRIPAYGMQVTAVVDGTVEEWPDGTISARVTFVPPTGNTFDGWIRHGIWSWGCP
jgi:hypothetical protein